MTMKKETRSFMDDLDLDTGPEIDPNALPQPTMGLVVGDKLTEAEFSAKYSGKHGPPTPIIFEDADE
jgi:hypothetical protein